MMWKQLKKEQHILELMLIVVCISLTALIYKMTGFKMVILHLFYLPIVLAGFFLGRYRAGILAVFSVISASLVTVLQINTFVAASPPLAVALAVTVWGATLCLTALLVGTLSDERATQADELHEAYVGVVEVLAKYLQGSNPQLTARTTRVAELSQAVASELRLTSKQTDDIRVAALMQDFGKIEITTKVISKAVDSLEAQQGGRREQYSFQGIDLVHSLGGVLRGAIPILLNQDSPLPVGLSDDQGRDIPIGAKIIRTVRDFDSLTAVGVGGHTLAYGEAMTDLRLDQSAPYDADVLNALERVLPRYAELPV